MTIASLQLGLESLEPFLNEGPTNESWSKMFESNNCLTMTIGEIAIFENYKTLKADRQQIDLF